MILHHTDSTRVFMYTLYENPRDYPNHYVLVKRFFVRSTISGWLSRQQDMLIGDDVDVIHDIMQRHGFVWIVRKPDDDPIIMGVYI